MTATEQKVAGASYIISFFQEVQRLTHSYAQYLNIMLEMEKKYGSDDLKEITPVERDTTSQTFQTVRYYALKCYVQYHAIKPALKLQDDQKIEDAYKTVKSQFIIPRKALEEYVIGLNSLLVQNIIQNLLQTSQDLVGQVYTNGDTQTARKPTVSD